MSRFYAAAPIQLFCIVLGRDQGQASAARRFECLIGCGALCSGKRGENGERMRKGNF